MAVCRELFNKRLFCLSNTDFQIFYSDFNFSRIIVHFLYGV